MTVSAHAFTWVCEGRGGLFSREGGTVRAERERRTRSASGAAPAQGALCGRSPEAVVPGGLEDEVPDDALRSVGPVHRDGFAGPARSVWSTGPVESVGPVGPGGSVESLVSAGAATSGGAVRVHRDVVGPPAAVASLLLLLLLLLAVSAVVTSGGSLPLRTAPAEEVPLGPAGRPCTGPVAVAIAGEQLAGDRADGVRLRDRAERFVPLDGGTGRCLVRRHREDADHGCDDQGARTPCDGLARYPAASVRKHFTPHLTVIRRCRISLTT